MSALHIGPKSFTANLIQGPLAGVSNMPFRRLVWEYSQPAFSYTEMISCKTLLYQPHLRERFIKKSPFEGPVCFQLSSSDPFELSEAVKMVTDFGADLIDLNCGCPKKKIRTRGCGSRLLANPAHLYTLIKAMKDHTHLPVSIKIRVDGHSQEQYNQAIAQVVEDAGADFLTVHGRHWSENYDTSCHYDQIQYFVERLSIPVIGNGDVACFHSLKKMLATGCAGVMIGRAGVGQPWLIKALQAQLQHQPFNAPTLPEIGALFIRHITELADMLGDEYFAVLQGRKLAKYYARPLKARQAFCAFTQQSTTIKELQSACNTFFT